MWVIHLKTSNTDSLLFSILSGAATPTEGILEPGAAEPPVAHQTSHNMLAWIYHVPHNQENASVSVIIA